MGRLIILRSHFYLTIVLIICTISPVFAQLSFPGRPIGDFRKTEDASRIYLLPPLDRLQTEALESEKHSAIKKSLRFALERPLQINPEYSGIWTTEGKTRIWRVQFISPGAFSVGLLFDGFELAEGVKVFLYDPGYKHVKGAYTNSNNKPGGLFAVSHIPGQEVIVEMQVPHKLDSYGKLNIKSLSHAFLPLALDAEAFDGRYGRSQDCEVDIACREGMPWKHQANSVVRIYNATDYCTGVVVNNTAMDGTPYVLTAEHCMPHRNEAGYSIFVFNYVSPECYGEDGSVEKSLHGAELMAVSDSIDFCLLKLQDMPPDSFYVFYSGWDLNASELSPGTCIHHPQGDVKKISFDFDDPSIPQSLGDIEPVLWDYHFDSFWWIEQWDMGSTEGGSSGAPLYNQEKNLIGWLSGGAARCGSQTGIDPETGRYTYDLKYNVDDYFTRFGAAWDHYSHPDSSLSTWLDPLNSGITRLEGIYTGTAPPPDSVEGKQFIIYPVPAGASIYIDRRSPSNMEYNFGLYNASGALILEGNATADAPLHLYSGSIRAGLYLLHIRYEGGEEVHKLIISE